MWTEKEKMQLELARTLPIDVLKTVAIEQAENCMLSEAYCREVSGAWHTAAEVAHDRRMNPYKKPTGFMAEMEV